MNASRCKFFLLFAALALAAGFVTHVTAADKAPAKPASGSAVPATVHGQPSVFTLGTTAKDPIKDPFFPKSIRLIPVITTNVIPSVVSTADFAIKGMSGPEGQRLVLINDHNFAEGEDGDVTIPRGTKRHIHVLKIKEFSAIIRADGMPDSFEVSLPKDLR